VPFVSGSTFFLIEPFGLRSERNGEKVVELLLKACRSFIVVVNCGWEPELSVVGDLLGSMLAVIGPQRLGAAGIPNRISKFKEKLWRLPVP